nr:MFS transporter [Arthrobacter gengyunqii]
MAIAAVFSQTAINLARPLISYKVLALGGDATAVGAVSASFALLPVAFALWMGRISDRASRLKILLVLGVGLLAASAAALSLAQGLVQVAIAAAALGMGHLAFTIAGQSAIAKLARPDRIDAGFGWFTAAFAVGQLVGPLLGGFLLGTDTDVHPAERLEAVNQALLLSGGIALLALPTCFVRLTGSRGATGRAAAPAGKEPVKAILSRPGVKANMLASLSLLATADILLAFLPLIGEEKGVPPVVVGALLAVRAAATIFSRLMLSVLLHRWTRDQLVFASLIGSAAGLIATPFVLDIGWAAALSLILAGFFLGLGQPLTMTLVSAAVPPEARGAALALRLLGNRVGQVLLPAAAGLAAAPLGPSGAVWTACLVMAVSAAVKAPAARRDGTAES